jgi:hypothetical protein
MSNFSFFLTRSSTHCERTFKRRRTKVNGGPTSRATDLPDSTDSRFETQSTPGTLRDMSAARLRRVRGPTRSWARTTPSPPSPHGLGARPCPNRGLAPADAVSPRSERAQRWMRFSRPPFASAASVLKDRPVPRISNEICVCGDGSLDCNHVNGDWTRAVRARLNNPRVLDDLLFTKGSEICVLNDRRKVHKQERR